MFIKRLHIFLSITISSVIFEGAAKRLARYKKGAKELNGILL